MAGGPKAKTTFAILSEVNKAVNTIVVAINDGPPIFEKALGEFEQYLAEERVRDDDPVLRAKRALEEAETREIMGINSAIGIRKAFDGVQIESYLRDFLLEHWVKVMVAATLRERTQPSFAKKFRDVVPDLVWSVQPKINPDDRKRLVKTIPAVLSTVREGLQLIEFSAAQSAEFFSRLMASHAQAVKALEVAYGTGAPLDPAAFKRRLDEVKIVEPPPVVENEPRAAADHHAGGCTQRGGRQSCRSQLDGSTADGAARGNDSGGEAVGRRHRPDDRQLATRHVVRSVDRRAERARASALDQSAPEFLSVYLGRNGQSTQSGAADPAQLRQGRAHKDGGERAAVRARGRRHDARPAGRRRARVT